MKYPFDYIVYFDGACEPCNPDGNMGFGFAIYNNKGISIKKHSSFVSAKKGNTNNIAEYTALGLALKYFMDNNLNDKKIYVRGDSMMVIKQMIGSWGIKNGGYVRYARKCKELLSNFSDINFSWIPRDQNYIADDLSKKELLKNNVTIKH